MSRHSRKWLEQQDHYVRHAAHQKPSFQEETDMVNATIKSMMDEVDSIVDRAKEEEMIISHERHLLKKVHEELTTIKKDMNKLQILVQQRTQLFAQAQTHHHLAQAHQLIDRVRETDKLICSFASDIEHQIEKHLVGQLDEIYARENFSQEEFNEIGRVARAFHKEVHYLAHNSREHYHNNDYEFWKKSLHRKFS
jgi:hypothetical protein